MREIIILPVVGIMILGFLPQLLTIAESSQEKTIVFADDMNNAIDCATRGIALEICSPNLMAHDFNPEIEQTLELGAEITDTINHQLENISQENDSIIILIE